MRDETERRLWLLGGGGHAAVVADCARAAGWRVEAFFDDDASRTLPGVRRQGSIAGVAGAREAPGAGEVALFAAVGDGRRRETWMEAHAGAAWPAIVHPTAIVSPSATIGAGALIGPGAVVNARARVERGAVVNTGAIVEHDARVGAFAHAAPGAVIAGGASLGARALLGLRAAILPNVSVGEDVTVGAGAAVVRDVPNGATVVGVPARARG